jgi:hypothetical protein
MKIGKILLWGAGIGTAIWAAKKFLFKPTVNPATGEGVPPRTANSGVRDEKTNFTGKSPRPIVKDNKFVCPAGWRWDNAERKCVPGGFGGFNGEFPGESNNDEFDLFAGKTAQKKGGEWQLLASKMKSGTKGVVRGEVCEWDGSNWVNCKKLGGSTARMKSGTKAIIRNEVCEWDGSNWVNCKKLGTSKA